MSVVELKNVSFAYRRHVVLEDVSLSVAEREFVWIVGPNGGGKTTLLKIMLGLLNPKKGKASVFGGSVLSARRRIGYMPQYARLDLRFPATVLDVALMGRLSPGLQVGPYGRDDQQVARMALEQVGLSDESHQPLQALSGGQQRRLMIARALACQPELLILDEPTANLDARIERQLFALLRELNERLTIIMVSHDPAFVSDFVEKVVCVNRTLATHPTADIERLPVDHLYGAGMRVVRHDLHKHGNGPKKDD